MLSAQASFEELREKNTQAERQRAQGMLRDLRRCTLHEVYGALFLTCCQAIFQREFSLMVSGKHPVVTINLNHREIIGQVEWKMGRSWNHILEPSYRLSSVEDLNLFQEKEIGRRPYILLRNKLAWQLARIRISNQWHGNIST